MSKEVCKLCESTGERCDVIDPIAGQSAIGGYSDPEMTQLQGPYWNKETWERYMQRSISMAQRGCIRQAELKDLIKKITAEKASRGELV